MFWQIVRFEVRYHLTNPLFAITAGLMLLLAFGAVSSDTVQVGDAIGNVNRNAPLVIVNLLGSFSVLGLFIVTAFVASAILRDFERRTHELFFSRPIGTARLLLARFVGSLAVSLALFLGPILGIVLGSLMPWVDPERIGPFLVAPYLWSAVVLIAPNLLFMGAVFFTMAGFTRSMLATYLGVIGTMVAYGVSQLLMRDLPSQMLATLLDPFGLAAVRQQTRYWTVVERNGSLPELTGLLLANRLLWIGVALAVLGFCLWRFNPARAARAGWRRQTAVAPPGADLIAPRPAATPSILQTLRFDRAAHFKMLAHQVRLETVTLLRSAPFIVMLVFGIINVVMNASLAERMFGTPVDPVTHAMLDALDGGYLFLLVIIVGFYAGESIWRDRSLLTAEVHDALPVPTWVYLAGKLAALLAVIVVFGLVGVTSAIGFQLATGFTRLEPGVYLAGLALHLIPYALCCVLAVTVQVVARSKFIGYLVILLYLMADDVFDALSMDHYLYRFPFLPRLPYSDMNGWGHYLAPYLWYALYWGCLCVVMLAACVVLWVRGTDDGWRQRLRLARRRITVPVRLAAAVGLIGFVACGGFIFYNTNILNDYLSKEGENRLRAEYERDYRQYLDAVQTRITAVSSEVDIYPAERRIAIRGRYTLANHNSEPVDRLILSLAPAVRIDRLDPGPYQVELDDTEHGFHILRLATPIPPGGERQLEFEIAVTNPGFVNNSPDIKLVANGTFFSNREVFPLVGYDASNELADRSKRRKYGLPAERHMPPIDDPIAHGRNDLGADADWIRFETTVSTSSDQIAIAPGYLEREWVEGDRRSFRYVMDAPILNFFAYLSAAYEVRRDHWGDVAIEVFYQSQHERNVDRMIESVKATLAYCTAAYGPYQHRQVRILEFPRYRDFAQSFDNTIPYSEAIGFIARLDTDDGIDTVFYVTAHEVAHQWWGHQVSPADTQGNTMVVESLAQYTAMMVMEHELGRDEMRLFLKYELDKYLRGRGRDLSEESPLLLVENQPYIHYSKGSVVMYALRDTLGEDAVNRALRRYVEGFKFHGPPYTTARDLRALLAEEAGPEHEQLLVDLVDTITLYSNRAVAASATALDDGRWRVTLEVEGRKLRADGAGVEHEIPLDDWVDVGVFGADDAVLYLEKRRLAAASETFEIEVDSRPERAGIDPYHKLVDRDSDDNVTRVAAGAT